MKTEGVKFLKRNRAREEDEEFMARATAGANARVIFCTPINVAQLDEGQNLISGRIRRKKLGGMTHDFREPRYS